MSTPGYAEVDWAFGKQWAKFYACQSRNNGTTVPVSDEQFYSDWEEQYAQMLSAPDTYLGIAASLVLHDDRCSSNGPSPKQSDSRAQSRQSKREHSLDSDNFTDDLNNFLFNGTKTVYVQAGHQHGHSSGSAERPFGSVMEALRYCANYSDVELVLMEGEYTPFTVIGAFDKVKITAEVDHQAYLSPIRKHTNFAQPLIVVMGVPTVQINGLRFDASYLKVVGIDSMYCNELVIDNCKFDKCETPVMVDGQRTDPSELGKDNVVSRRALPWWVYAVGFWEFQSIWALVSYLLCAMVMLSCTLYWLLQGGDIIKSAADLNIWIRKSLLTVFMDVFVLQTIKVCLALAFKWKDIMKDEQTTGLQAKRQQVYRLTKWHAQTLQHFGGDHGSTASGDNSPRFWDVNKAANL